METRIRTWLVAAAACAAWAGAVAAGDAASGAPAPGPAASAPTPAASSPGTAARLRAEAAEAAREAAEAARVAADLARVARDLAGRSAANASARAAREIHDKVLAADEAARRAQEKAEKAAAGASAEMAALAARAAEAARRAATTVREASGRAAQAAREAGQAYGDKAREAARHARGAGPGGKGYRRIGRGQPQGRGAGRRGQDGAMSPLHRSAVQVIHQEHAALSAMLRSIGMLLQQARAGKAAPDFAALRAMLFYVDEFPGQRHHRKESELLFPKLRGKAPQARGLLDRLEDDHARGEGRIRDVEHALLAWEMMGEPRREAFEKAMEDFTGFYLRHMALEEREVLPLAMRVLSWQDWRDIDEAFAANRDPLTGHKPDAQYEALFSRIVHLVPAPVGLGPA